MRILNIFKRKPKGTTAQDMQIIRKRRARSQEAVYQAVKQLNRPVNGMTVAQHMHYDSASVTPRLSELVKKGRLKVGYVKKGLDGIYRRYYVVNE